MDAFRSLENNPSVRSWEVVEYRRWSQGHYYRLHILLVDGSLLIAREFSSVNERMYSFHWRTKDGTMIIRWDNAPHYRHLATFPHHRHEKENIVENKDIDLADVLREIGRRLSHQQ